MKYSKKLRNINMIKMKIKNKVQNRFKKKN